MSSHSLAVAIGWNSFSHCFHACLVSSAYTSARPIFIVTVEESTPLAPLFAALSAFSFPERQTCAGTHWKRTSVPRVISWWVVVAISRTRSSRAFWESDLMAVSAALESLQITMAKGVTGMYTCSGPWLYNLFFPALFLFDWVGGLWPSYLNVKSCVLGRQRRSSGAVWESRWTSWAVRPNEPSGFRGRKELLNRASALVTTCP